MTESLQRVELGEGQSLTAHRIVHTDDASPEALAPSFRSRRALNKPRMGRELHHDEIWEGVSVNKTQDGARSLWQSIADARARRNLPRAPLGEYIAELRLEGGQGFQYEDLQKPDGHMTIWGDPLDLARHVVDIAPAELQEEGECTTS